MQKCSTRVGVLLGLCTMLSTTPAWADPCMVEGISGEQALRIMGQLRSEEFGELITSADIHLDALSAFGPDHTPSQAEVQTLFAPGGPLSFRRIMRFRRNLWRSRIAPPVGSETRRVDVNASRALAATFPVLQSLGDLPACRGGAVSFPSGLAAIPAADGTVPAAEAAPVPAAAPVAERAPVVRSGGAATSTGAVRSEEAPVPAEPVVTRGKAPPEEVPPSPPSSDTITAATAAGTDPTSTAEGVCRLAGGTNEAAIMSMLANPVATAMTLMGRRLAWTNTHLAERSEEVWDNYVIMSVRRRAHPFQFLSGEFLEDLYTQNHDGFVARRAAFVRLQNQVIQYGCPNLAEAFIRRVCRPGLANGRVPESPGRDFPLYEGDEEVPDSVVSRADVGRTESQPRVLESELPMLYRTWVAQISYMDTITRRQETATLATEFDALVERLSSDTLRLSDYGHALTHLNRVINSVCAPATAAGSFASHYRGEERRMVAEQAEDCLRNAMTLRTRLVAAMASSSCRIPIITTTDSESGSDSAAD